MNTPHGGHQHTPPRRSWRAAWLAAALMGLVTVRLPAQGGGGDPRLTKPAADFRQAGTIQLVLDPQGFRTRIWDLEFSPDGQWLAAAGEKEVRLYDVASRRLLRTLRGDRAESAYGSVYAVAFSPDGRELVVGIDDFSDAGSLRVYDVRNLDDIRQLVGGMNVAARRLAFSRDGRYLVAAGQNGNLYVYDWPARRIVQTIPPPRADQPIYDGLAFPSREPVLLAFAFDGPRLYSIPDGRLLTPRDRIPEPVLSWMANVAGGQVEYPLGAGRTPPQIWDVQLDRGVWLGGGASRPQGRPEYWVGVFGPGARSAAPVYNAHRWTISAVAASPSGDLAASGDLFGEIHLWNRRTAAEVHRFTSLAQKFYEVSFDQGGTRLAFGTTHYRGSEYRRNHFGPADYVFDLPRRALGEVQFAPELTPQVERTHIGDYRIELKQVGPDVHLVSYRGDRENARYRLPAGANPMCYTLLDRHGFDIRNPVIFGDDRGVLACWDSDTDRLHRAFIGHGSMITSVGASPDGKWLVSSSTDGELCLFPLTGRRPTGHPDFRRQSEVVIEVKPGTSSHQAGVQVGDRIISLDGKSITELETLLLLGRYDYRPGQQVPVVMERGGRRFDYQMTLADGYDFVEPLLHLFITAAGEWILWTQQGYYDCSPGADRFIGWHKNRGPDKSAEFHAVQQFRKQLYRPDVIDQVIALGNVPEAIARANAAQGRQTAEFDLRNAEEFARLHPPGVQILSPEAGFVSDRDTISVTARVSSPNALAVRDVTFLVDGIPAHVAHPNAGSNGVEIDVTAEIRLTPGRHTLGVVAGNGQTTSPVVSRPVAYRGGAHEVQRPVLPDGAPRPKVYVLAVGIARYAHSGNGFSDLHFAAEDARQFVRIIERHRHGKLYGEVETRLLVDAEATRRNILDGLDWLVRSCRPGDIAMIFVSAHGFRDELQNFYLATHDVELDKLRATALSWREIARTLHEDFPQCKRLLFLDTCHSGGVSAGQVVYDPVHDVVAPEVGVIVFTSCQPRQESFELSEWNHGAFTYALMETLRDPKGDVLPPPAGDGGYDATELKGGIEYRVKSLTRDRQRPFIFVPPTMAPAPLLQVIAE